MSWRIRPAAPADIALLPDIEIAAATLFPPGRIDDPEETHSLEEFRDFAARESAWVAQLADQVIGFVVARALDGALHVVELAVKPEFGRRGAGRALMRRAMEESRARGFPRVTLTTFADLPWNAPFYRSLGFRVLAGDEVTEPLRRILEAERAAGLTRRVAMAFDTGVLP